MKTAIDTRSRSEGDAFKRALDQPSIRAVTAIGGYLLEIESLAERRRLLVFLLDTLGDAAPASGNGQPLRLHDGASTSGD